MEEEVEVEERLVERELEEKLLLSQATWTITMTNTFRELHQRAILETCDL